MRVVCLPGGEYLGEAQDGIDLLRIEGDRIAEAWLFSSDPRSEDAFWAPADRFLLVVAVGQHPW
ncbi:hypothetical protein [Pseudonocardia sp. MH-G8]|uniref:hypothetical protein n=1 Tax=Pseudonocardia sp. MH-G8 TaxID=1854588 RepID=UPI000BA026B8|nr:hypothetical protein [Pseudonocardia sp. MH-G8]OZM80791.1 hypothetical protein CFP66_18810 [Pseudonocardia sp. MH-G8]